VHIVFKGNPSIWLGKQREKDILRLSERHLRKIISLAIALKDFVQSFSTNNTESMEKTFKEIFSLEREADDEKEKIIVELSKGPFHPMDREDIIRLVLTMDDVASNIKAASTKLLYVDPVNVPDNVKKDVAELVNMVYGIVMGFADALQGLIESSKDVLKLAENVERKEEAIDEFRVVLMAKILEWGEKSRRISALLMLKEAVENLEGASDCTEDAANIIRGIVAIGS
jgi:predicted phosphate transport protein (TIGR00153 family)